MLYIVITDLCCEKQTDTKKRKIHGQNTKIWMLKQVADIAVSVLQTVNFVASMLVLNSDTEVQMWMCRST